jgi:hypothetical protein
MEKGTMKAMSVELNKYHGIAVPAATEKQKHSATINSCTKAKSMFSFSEILHTVPKLPNINDKIPLKS